MGRLVGLKLDRIVIMRLYLDMGGLKSRRGSILCLHGEAVVLLDADSRVFS